MTHLCENIRCKHCRHSPFYGYICYYIKTIQIDKKGKCSTYEKDTLENIKLAKAKKPKIVEKDK
jgi:hypothetical protein